MTTKKKTKRGGYRPGARRPVELEDAGDILVTLDRPTREILSQFGGGKISRGIRRAGIVIEFLGDKFEEYKTLATIEEAKRAQMVKEGR